MIPPVPNIINGKHGNRYSLGHRHVSPYHPEMMYLIRARPLNSITWMALVNALFFKNQRFVKMLFPNVAYELMISLGILGLIRYLRLVQLRLS